MFKQYVGISLVTVSSCFLLFQYLGIRNTYVGNNKLDLKIQHEISLRYDWTNLEPLSVLARNMSNHQQNQCHLPLANYRHRKNTGLGSDLHVWSQALCHGMEKGFRVRSEHPWIWIDQESCTNNNDKINKDEKHGNKKSGSSLVCYFPQSELLCPNDAKQTLYHEQIGGVINYDMTGKTNKVKLRGDCTTLNQVYGISEVRAAAMEFLFTKVSPIIQQEALRQLKIIFGSNGRVPKNLITVQIRWGDKRAEMKLVEIDEYINAVKILIDQRSLETGSGDTNEQVSILLSTEDPTAVQMFQEAAPDEWKIYVDVYFEEMLPYRRDQYNGNAFASIDLQGKPGLKALGSLLVAMEANNFVLTTKSNWSRLMNELRKNILDPRCQNCTRMIDLRPGEW